MTRYRILVVEDEKDIQSLVAEELEDLGYDVALASNGREGLDAVSAFRPHLILSDITMPVMNGYEMLTTLRSHFPSLRSVPIIFLSALADRRHIIEGKKLGVDDYITKPIDFELLLATIEARMREVERMTLQKEEQMMRLYQTLSSDAAARKRPKPALLICDEWTDVSPITRALEDCGVPVVTQNRGSQLDAYLTGKEYSALIMTENSNDMSAKVAIMQSGAFAHFRKPTFLFIDSGKKVLEGAYWHSFTKVAPLATAEKVLAEGAFELARA